MFDVISNVFNRIRCKFGLLKGVIRSKKAAFYYFAYTRIKTPFRAFRFRRKKSIKVVFLLSEITTWKTESLYLEMLKHERFNPLLYILPTNEPVGAHLKVIEYCKSKGYEFHLLDEEMTIVEQTNADILLYTKPYMTHYHWRHQLQYNLNTVNIFIPYAFHSLIEDWAISKDLFLYSWRYFYENEMSAKEYRPLMRNKGRNIRVTGFPVMDDIIKEKESDDWQWNDKSGRKRIIYAPHHTIPDKKVTTLNGISYSTFLDRCEFMLEMAEKYRDDVVWAFKPHPLLRMKLDKVWGKERTEAYYKRWEALEGCQIETSKYANLFAHSDAMIHDCSSFTIEYLYTCKPVMYLCNNVKQHESNMTAFAKEAFELHYFGYTDNEIESFIQDVISGRDSMKEKRIDFYKKELLPPNGKSASENIIDSILGNS